MFPIDFCSFFALRAPNDNERNDFALTKIFQAFRIKMINLTHYILRLKLAMIQNMAYSCRTKLTSITIGRSCMKFS